MNWWESAPLAEPDTAAVPAVPQASPSPATTPAQAPSSAPAADKWWEVAPLAEPAPQPPQDERGLIRRGLDLLTGRGQREFDLPQFFGSTSFPIGTALHLAGGLAAATDPEQERDVVRSAVPDAKFREDKFGNVIVGLPNGREYYLNPKGMTALDVLRGVAQGGVYAATAAPAGLASNLVGRGLVAGTAAGATSLGLDAAAIPFGSEQGVNPTRAAVTALAGGAMEGAATVIGKISDSIRRGVPDQEIVATARLELGKAGFKPEEITDELVKQFVKEARTAVNPQAAAVTSAADTLPVRVPVTRGDATGRPSDQMFESMAAKGAYGKIAEAQMGGVRAQQQEALRANVPVIQARLAGGKANVTDRGDAGAMAQRALTDKADALKGQVDAAYETARATTGGLPRERVNELQFRIGEAAADYLSAAPVAQKRMEDLAALGGAADTADVLVGRLFDWRRATTNLAANAPNPTEAAALKAMVKEFDRGIDGIVKSGLMSGDGAAVDAWKKAIRLRRGYGRLFQGDDLIEEIVEKEARGGRPTLKVAPEAVSNLIFGVERAGLVSRPQLARDLWRIRSVLGPTSPEWNAIREEAFMRLAQAGEGPMAGADRMFSGAKFKQAWDQALRNNPTVIHRLFTPEERQLIGQFANVAARVTNRVPGGDNPSGTAVALSNMMQRLAAATFAGDKLMALLVNAPLFRQGMNVVQTVKVIGRTQNPVVHRTTLPAGPATAVGAVAGPSVLENP